MRICHLRTVSLAALLCVGLARNAHAADPAISDEARRHFKAGVALLQDPEGERVEEAYRAFQSAYQISQSPKMLGNIGLCAMKLERDAEAIEAYAQYLREVSDIDADERAQITRDLQTLSVSVVRVSGTLEPVADNVILADVRIPSRGDRINNAYKPKDGKFSLGLRPGHHIITLRAPGFEDSVWEFDAMAGTKETHDFKLKVAAKPVVAPAAAVGPGQAPATTGPSMVPWIVAGVGGAMLVGGTITGILALGKTNDIEKQCPNNSCARTFDLEGARSSARTMVTVTDVLLIGGAVVAGAGIGWALFAPQNKEPTSKPVARVGGMCTGAGCAANLSVVFQ
jgi:hypothetical protein